MREERYEHVSCTTSSYWAFQAVKLITNGGARYLLSVGPRIGHGDEASWDRLYQVALAALAEDKAMIEAQQEVVDATPQHRFIRTIADRAIGLYSAPVSRRARIERDAEAKPPEAAVSPDTLVGAQA